MEKIGLMPGANSVTSNQETLHKDLEKVVRKYARTTFLRPIAEHTRDAFAKAEEFVRTFYERKGDPALRHKVGKPRPVILDSGCGTGESTIHIARRFPNIPVIGIDKSGVRLDKAGNPSQTAGENVPENTFWIRAELLDFWRLALDRVKSGEWTIPYHAVYYPNPWPKQSEATRRFHMHPIFPTLLALGDVTELRTNWEIYAREFAEAAKIVYEENARKVEGNDNRGDNGGRFHETHDGTAAVLTAQPRIVCESFDPTAPETAFERKYKDAGQKLWRVVVGRV